MTRITPCMGGWCSKRNGCAHYHEPERNYPVERLCGQQEEPEPVKPEPVKEVA